MSCGTSISVLIRFFKKLGWFSIDGINFSTLEKYDFCFSGYQVCIPTCWAQNKIQNQNLCLGKTIHT